MTRGLAIALMLACAGAQPALSSSLITSALAFGIHSHGHEHSIALHSDGTHIDIVLSHGDGGSHDHAKMPADHDHPASLLEGAHVVHVTAVEAANSTSRRVVIHQPLSLPIALVRPPDVARASPPCASFASHARGLDQLRTIVLRL